MEMVITVLALCEGNAPLIGGFPSQGAVTWSFDVFFDLRLNNWLSTQWRCWWFEMPYRYENVHAGWSLHNEMNLGMLVTFRQSSGCSRIEMQSYQNRKSYYKDKIVWQLSYLHNGKSYTWKDTLYIETSFCGFSLVPPSIEVVNSLRPNDIYALVISPSLVQIKACRLVSIKPLSEPMLEYCSMDP